MLKAIAVACSTLIVGCTVQPQTADHTSGVASNWPLIEARSANFPINLESGTPTIKFDIARRGSNFAIYRLICFSGDQGIDTIYSGGLLCAIGTTDMSDDEIFGMSFFSTAKYDFKSIYSRGNFNHEDLQGVCAEHPLYGRRRDFRFRGMLITLEIKNIRLSETRRGNLEPPSFVVSEAELSVTARPDHLAILSAEAEVASAPPNGDSRECQRQIEAMPT